MQNYDDVDLGIVAITTVLLVVGLALAFTGQIKEGLGFMGAGVTAISTLAGRRVKPEAPTDQKPQPPATGQSGFMRVGAMIFLLMFTVTAGVLFYGCATSTDIDRPPEQTTCDQVEDSFICNKIRDMGWDPAQVRNYIIDIDLAALAVSKNYNKADALSYTAKAREIIDRGCSYRYLITWFSENSQSISEDWQGVAAAGIIVISRHISVFDSTRIISQGDRQVLLVLLDKIDAEVERYF